MEVVQLLSSAAAYVSSVQKEMVKKCNNCLKIGRGEFETNQSIVEETLIKFSMNALSNQGTRIKKAVLRLNVEGWYCKEQQEYYKINIRINEMDYDSQWVTWDTKPKTHFYKEYKVATTALQEGVIKLEITEIVKEWLNKESVNYGITLTTPEEEVSLTLYSDYTECGPTLSLYYEEQSCECPQKETVALQVQVTDKQVQVTENNKNLQFDSICARISDKISYDFDTDEIIVKEKGNYLVQWWIGIDGSGDIKEIRFVLENITGTISCECSAPVFVLSQPSGNAIIQVTTVPEKLRLVNKSGAAIQFANLSVQASLVIAQI